MLVVVIIINLCRPHEHAKRRKRDARLVERECEGERENGNEIVQVETAICQPHANATLSSLLLLLLLLLFGCWLAYLD